MKIPPFNLTQSNVSNLCLKLQGLDWSRKWRIRIEEDDEKTRLQEEKYHAMISDVAEQCKHLNANFDRESWKRLLVDQFRRDSIDSGIERLIEYWQRNEVKLVPSLDGSGLVALGQQTRKFPWYVASAFIEWLIQYGAENKVKWSEPKRNYEN